MLRLLCIYCLFEKTVFIQGALVLIHTVSFFVVVGVISSFWQDLFVVAGNDTFYVFGAAVININRVPIKDLVILMMVWKVLVDQLKKAATDFFCYIFIKRGFNQMILRFLLFLVFFFSLGCMIVLHYIPSLLVLFVWCFRLVEYRFA